MIGKAFGNELRVYRIETTKRAEVGLGSRAGSVDN